MYLLFFSAEDLPEIEICDNIMDVGFLLDSSGSITNYYSNEKKFLNALANSLGMSETGSHAGVITFR